MLQILAMSNRLIHESSPYLLQHAHNPVDWYPWGPDALAKAQSEQKLLLISIGYAACHWCHVMEKESFEDQEVAKLMNDHFVCIKVDREERPDIDKVYMDAVVTLSGHGGWPLNAFALPDGRPVYGGTYYSKPQWMHLLRQLADLLKLKPEQAMGSAEHLTAALQERFEVPDGPGTWEPETHAEMLQRWIPQMDTTWGGRDTAQNKFPLPANQLYLLRAGFLSGNKEAIQLAMLTLNRMALGGIFDQVGGGFSRYSVDRHWHIPHFEKMLYDNGQLVSAYCEAYQIQPAALFERTVTATLDWVMREMTSPEGGFYASLDADSEGVEGKFYAWTWEELATILADDLRPFADYYQVTPMGNWEHTNVLIAAETEEEYAVRWKLDAQDFAEYLEKCRGKILDARATRVRPGLDDKILVSWNALMAKGFADAYRVFRQPAYLEVAVRNLRFIQEKMMTEEGALYRNYKAGKRTIPAFLDDYAYLADAALAVYQVTFEETWLHLAQKLTSYVMAHFSHEEGPLFFYTSDTAPTVVTRKTEVQDDVIPSSNAVMAHVLQALGLYFGNTAYLDRASTMVAQVKDSIVENPAWHAYWANMALKLAYNHYEVVVTGPDALSVRFKLEQPYFPNKLLAGTSLPSALPILEGRLGESLQFFVCEHGVCHLPVHTVDEAVRQIQ